MVQKVQLNISLDNDVIRPLCIKLPQMNGYIKWFESNKTMFFKVIDNKPLKSILKYGNDSLMNTEFDSELVCGDNDKYIKTKKVTWR